MNCSSESDSIAFLKTMEEKEFRVLIKYYFWRKKIHLNSRMARKVRDVSASSKRTICRWSNEFKRGCTRTNDAPRSVRLIEISTPENTNEIHHIVLHDWKVKIRE